MYWICLFYFLVALSKTRAILLGSTEETLSQMFSTYDITIPVQVDEAGNFLSHNLKDVYRKKRSAEEFVGDNNTTNYDKFQNEKQSNIYFNFTAFGVSYNVELQNKRRLIAPGAKFVRYLSNGSVESLINDKEVYTGRVRNEDQSSVAMTSFDGLAGYIKTEKGEFFIEPLDKRNDDDAKNPQRHVVYEKRDLIYKRGGEGNAQRKSIFEESESLMQNSQFLDASHENDGEKRYKRHSNKKKVYNIEVLLTADSTVADFHGTHGVKDYLITLMNIVDEIYHDETIGHVINIVIVQLSLLNGKDSKNLIAHEDPAVSLKNVCKWAHDMYNADRNGSDSSYDHAIFLTRQKFGPTGMEGYAHVTGMCRPLRSCTLNHEDGFSSAFVVAHETGHVLGMEHDGEGNKCGIETSMGSIMAPLVQAAFHRYHWSRCSQYELKGNIRKFHCLLNNPHVPDWGLTPEYPGVYYSMNDQCRFDFGPGYKQCTAFQIDNVCRTLWCSHDDNPMYCKTKNGPPVDGTACAENMWCFKSHCVWRNNMQGAINGAWGTWSNYGICSRSCGTGVMSRSRECNRPKPAYGGKNCRGISVEYGLCNKQKCTGAYDYRAEQCRYHQKKQYANRRHTWLPYENEMADLKCELFCVSKETTTILSMGSPVADGTRCSYDDPNSICINAECMKVGCDGIIGSSKRDDECGVCDGDGSQCRKVASTYRKIVRKPFKSYMKTFTIPANARQVQIREATDTPTDILALKNRRTGRYVLNHKGSVIEGDLTKQFIDSETKWNYSRKRDREILSTRGPLSVDYLLMVVVRNRVKSKKIRINYSYVIHSSYIDNKRYQYAIRKWYPCSVTCGEGTRLARYGCRNKATKKWVRKTYCPASPPKRHRERCSMDCEPQPRWNIGRWESCSKTCGGVGQKVRKVNCQKKNKVGNSKTVDDAECNNISAKPIAQKPCTAPTCPPEWTVGNWSLCSVSCGKGTRLRSVVCISRGREVAVDKCLGEKPENLDYCHMPRCTSCESNHSETLCNLKSMAKFCSIAGYQRLCCATCRSRFGEFTGESRENKTTKRNSSRSPRSVTAVIADDIPSG